MSILAQLILAAAVVAPTDASSPGGDGVRSGAVELFRCDFESRWDTNGDQWPDRWTRKRDTDFPAYLNVRIEPDTTQPANHVLRIDLDGGAAALFSPEVPVQPSFSYGLTGMLRTSGLKNDRAFMSVTFLDKDHKPLETYFSPRMMDAVEARQINLGPVTPQRAEVRYAIVGLHLEPASRGSRLEGVPQPDLKGAAMFDDLVLVRMPRMVLKCNFATNVLPAGATPEFTCFVTGLPSGQPTVKFTLQDVRGGQLSVEDVPLKAEEESTTGGETSASFRGVVRWRPKVAEPGFYRVRVVLPEQSQTLSLIILPDQNRPISGEFGWTLPRGDDPIPLGPLAELLNQAGVHWVKFPVWSAGTDRQRAEKLVWFTERLNFQNMHLVGLLLAPPTAASPTGSPSNAAGAFPPAADVFSPDAQNWYPSLEPVLTRLSLKVRWWQLGDDQDTSFVGCSDLPGRISQLKSQMQHFNQELNLGFGWRWINEPPTVTPSPWAFLSMSARPSLTADELQVYLSRERSGKVKRWTVLEPLPKGQYSLDTRVQDLAQRMMAAKIQQADAIFNPQPFDDDRGLMNTDGSPGELFLPWRTMALALAGSQYVGRINLPNGSSNHVFARDGEAFMVVWNDRPTKESLFLGENVKERELFGRVTDVAVNGKEQVIAVGPLPTIVTGLNEGIARLRMSFAFSSSQLPNVVGQPLSNPFTFKNPFPQGVSGEIKLALPESWRSKQRETSIARLGPGEQAQLPFEVSLPFDTITGRQPIRADFNISAGNQLQFSVYHWLDVGQGDVELEVQSRLNDKGELMVEQHLINYTDQAVSFKCQLFIPDRQRMLSAVIQQERGRDSKVYRIPAGRDLIGKTLSLRAEEIGGGRVLNQRFVVEE